MVNLTEIFKKLEQVAPVSLSDEFCKDYGLYDNSGIIINCGKQINGALFSLELSKKVVEQAKIKGFNLIVTHHPAIYSGVLRIDAEDGIAECIKNGISVISMHLNFDAAPEGIDYHLMRGLGGQNAEILDVLSNGGYGRVYCVKPLKFSEYAKTVSETFSSKRALFYGADDKTVKTVASFCGAGCDNKAMAFALSHNADVFVSSDMKHHEIAYLLEKGINVIHLTHYSAESYGFGKIYSKIAPSLSIPTAFFTDNDLM